MRAIEDGPDLLGLLGYIYAVTGQREQAVAMLGELEKLGRYGYVSPYYRALTHVGLGDKGAAFACLQQAYEDRSLALIGIGTYGLRTDPHLDSLRPDPRFAELLKKVGLEK